MTEPFSYPKTLSSSWAIIKKNWKFLVPALLATAVVLALLQILQNITQDHWLPSLIASILSIVIGIAVSLGWANVTLHLIRGTSKKWDDFMTDTKSWLHYFVARIIYGIFTLGAMVAVSVPILVLVMSTGASTISAIISIVIGLAGVALVVWLVIRYLFISFVSIDHPRIRGWHMMKESAKLTKGNITNLFGFLLLIGLINIIGLLLFLVGLLITIPLTGIATGFVYEHLKKIHAHGTDHNEKDSVHNHISENKVAQSSKSILGKIIAFPFIGLSGLVVIALGIGIPALIVFLIWKFFSLNPLTIIIILLFLILLVLFLWFLNRRD